MSVKKSFDREKMYQKIMPTYAAAAAEEKKVESAEEVQEVQVEEPVTQTDAEIEELDEMSTEAYLHNTEIQKLNKKDSDKIIVNITESIVVNKLDMVLENMGCCKCHQCKMDIIAMSLNQLTPHYVVDTPPAIAARIETSPVNQEVVSILLKSALKVRKNPRH